MSWIGKKSGNRRGSISFSLETIMSMVLVLIVGALIMYFLYVYLYQGKMMEWMDMLKESFSKVLGAQVE